MRIKQLTIKDFRNLRLVEMDDIPNLVVLAGANGCGKTAILDAIVLAKEAVGSYFQPLFQSCIFSHVRRKKLWACFSIPANEFILFPFTRE